MPLYLRTLFVWCYLFSCLSKVKIKTEVLNNKNVGFCFSRILKIQVHVSGNERVLILKDTSPKFENEEYRKKLSNRAHVVIPEIPGTRLDRVGIIFPSSSQGKSQGKVGKDSTKIWYETIKAVI